MDNFDLNININKYFYDLAMIPHGSYNEEKIADYITNIAIENHLKYIRDEMHNIIIFKEASIGYGDHEPIILQAHIDMVNEKNNDSHHDFDHDPLDLYVEDGMIKAKGTTLGADDCYGVAYMLSILTDDSLNHPALECIFTVQEEVGLYGAAYLDCSMLKARKFIGLDSGKEGQTCTSSSGGCVVDIYKDIKYYKSNKPAYMLSIKGLLGGHSGGCIHLSRGNANKLAARLMHHLLVNGIDIQLCNITGGLKNNAIPRECNIIFKSYSSIEKINQLINDYTKLLLLEFNVSDPYLEIVFNQYNYDICISASDSEAIIYMLYLMNTGMIDHSQSIKGLTTLSLNMGVIRMNEDHFCVSYSIRSPLKHRIQDQVDQLKLIASIYNSYIKQSGFYPGWDYNPHSALRLQFKTFYKEYTKQELIENATHGGLEIGIFIDKLKDLDVITMGPNTYDCHTPDERMEVQSFYNNYILLTKFLETL